MSELLNVSQVAAILKVSPDTVLRRFANMKGVINLGSGETRGKRGYRVIRIPKHLVEKYVGHPIEVPVLEPKPQAQKGWKERAARTLAKAIKDNTDNPTDRETFKEIQSHARTLTFVPEEEWDQVSFFYPGEEGK